MWINIRLFKDCLKKVKNVAGPAPGNGRTPLIRLMLTPVDGKTVIRLETFNGELFASSSCVESGSAIPVPFEGCLPAAHLEGILNALGNEGNIGVEPPDTEEGSTITFLAEKARWDVPFAATTVLPKPHDDSAWEPFGLGEVVLESILRCLHAASREWTRTHIAGVRVESTENRLYCVATDGHRLALEENPIAPQNDKFHWPGITLPFGLCDYLKRHRMYDVKISPDRHFISMSSVDASVQASLIDSDYPAWRQVIPQEDGMWIFRVNMAEALGALDVVNAIATPGSNSLALVWRGTSELEMLREHNGNKASARFVAVPENTETGGTFRVSVNRMYFQQMLESFSAIASLPEEERRECVLMVPKREGAALLCEGGRVSREVIMPMRTVGEAEENA